jgi:hypothetical protein
MLRYTVRKYNGGADQGKPRNVPLAGAKRAKAFRDSQRAEQVSAYQLSANDIASAESDMDVGKQTGPVGHPRYGPRSVNCGNRNGPLVMNTSIACF